MLSTMANVKHLPANGGRAFAQFGQSLSFKAAPGDTDDALFPFEQSPSRAGVKRFGSPLALFTAVR
jgi:hypothetical protein